MRDPALLWAALLLTLSGAVSLVLEVTWMRWLRLVFGSTTWAVSTILASYMLGLGLGGLFGGYLAHKLRRGWLWYGFLEIAIGAYAFLVPWLLTETPLLHGGTRSGSEYPFSLLAPFLTTVGVLFLPTFFMGATLPVLVQAVLRLDRSLAPRVGLLYGMNTAGAVAGVFIAVFMLFPSFGLWYTNLVAAMTDLAVGTAAILYWRRQEREVPDTGERVAHLPASKASSLLIPSLSNVRAVWLPLLGYGTIGFTALGYEVAWTRALALAVGSSTHAFAVMLAAFLIGIALGALLTRGLILRLESPLFAFSGAVLTLAVVALAAGLALQRLPTWQPWLFVYLGNSPAGIVLSLLATSLSVMLIPTLIFGSLFPLLVHGLHRALSAPLATGFVYFANTIGAALGAFVTGFWAIPVLGIQSTLLALATLNSLAAFIVGAWSAERPGRSRLVVPLAALALIGAIWGVPWGWDRENLARGVYRFPLDEIDVGVQPVPLEGVNTSELLFYREGWNSVVSVHRELGELSLRVNGKADASSHGDLPTQVLLAHVGAIFGQPPQHAAVVGLASGVTAGSLALHPGVQVEVIEIEPAMVEASRFFDAINHRPLDQPNVRLILDDARSYLRSQQARYDLIISEPSNPWMSGAANLFTREFFQAARNALQPDGKLLQWVQVYAIRSEAIASILAALQSEFPHVYGFTTATGSPDLLFLASTRPLTKEDFPSLDRLPQPVVDDLARIGVDSDVDLWSLLHLPPSAVRDLVSRAPVINSDDNLYVELSAPWSLYDTVAIEQNWRVLTQVAESVPEFWRDADIVLSTPQLVDLGFAYLRRRATHIARGMLELAQSTGQAPGARALALAIEAASAEEREEAQARLLAELRQIATQQPSREVWLLLGTWERDEMNFAQALAASDRLLHLSPRDLAARALRFETLLGLKQYEAAWNEAEELLRSPYAERNHELKAKAATAAIAVGKLETAARLLREYLQWYPDSPQEWSTLAQLYDKLGETELTEAARRNAEQAKRNVVLVLHQQARRLLLAGDREGAVQRLRTALLFSPDYQPARAELRQLGLVF